MGKKTGLFSSDDEESFEEDEETEYTKEDLI